MPVQAGPTAAARDELWLKAAVAGVVFTVMVLAGYYGDALASTFPRDRLGYVIGRDFVNVWMVGHVLETGRVAEVFDMVRYNALVDDVFGLPSHLYNWSYPPHIFVVLWPFGLMPYFAAYALWCALGFALYLWAALGRDWSWNRLLLVGCAPVAVLVVFTGQNGFFTAALLLATWRHLDRRPLLAGVFLGFLTLKPQLGLAFPLILLMTGRWRVIIAAGATTLALVAASVWLVGIQAWIDYVRIAMPVQKDVLDHATGLPLVMMPTPFMQARMLGADPAFAAIVQLPFTLAALAAIVFTFARKRDTALQFVALIGAGLLLTPYAFNYDMVALGAAVIALAMARPWPIATQRFFVLVWATPVLSMVAGFAWVPLATPVLVVLVGFCVATMVTDARARSPAPIPGTAPSAA